MTAYRRASTLLAPAGDLLERDFTGQVIGTKARPGIARQVGFLCYHTYRSTRSEPGWPDWALVREREIKLELKTAKGKVSEPQKMWGRALLAAGAEFYIPRPDDLDLLALILSSRMRPDTGMLATAEAQAARLTLLQFTKERLA